MMFLFFEGFQPEIVLILFVFSVKHSDLLMTKITPNVNNLLPLIGDTESIRSIKLFTSIEHRFT